MSERQPRRQNQRPIRESRIVGKQIFRIPEDGYLTPRLRQDHNTNAIGFVHNFDVNQEDE